MTFNSYLKYFGLLLLTGIFLFGCSESKENSELASFKNGHVLTNEYIDHFLLSSKYKPDKLPTEENLKEIVLKKALEKMAVQEAESMNIDKDSLYQYVIQNNERRLLYQNYVQSEITPTVITDSLVQKFYSEFSPQYRMKYIMRPFLKNSTEEFLNSQKKKIEEAYKRLKNGDKFEDITQKYSQDISSNKKGGDIGWMIRESMGDEALREVYDTLTQYTYSKPFKGYGGYYILYKGKKREVSVPPFENIKQQIWKTLYQSRKIFIENAIDRRFKELSKKYHYQEFSDIVTKLLKKAGSNKNKPKTTTLNFGNLNNNDKATIIAKYDGGVITVKDLFADRKRSPTNEIEFFNRFKSISRQHLLSKHAKELNLQNVGALKEQLNNMKTSLLRTILYQRVVKDKVLELLSENKDLKGEEKIRKRSEYENSLRTEFENKLKIKYEFRFETKNFKKALEIALQKKKLQNSELDKKKKN